MPATRLLALLAALSIACGDSDEPAQEPNPEEPGGHYDEDDDNGGDDQPDTTAPSVVSITPADGDSGVRSDVQVVIVFSEAMDEASVENALITSSLGLVDLDWSESYDTLTITPHDALPYVEGEGVDPSVADPFEFSVVLGEGSTDLAGNDMAGEAATWFTTLRRMHTEVDHWNMLTGSATASGQSTDDDDYILVGDDDGDDGHRGFLTFDPSISWTTVEIEEATLLATVISDEIGKPYAKLGELHIELGHFNELDNAAFNLEAETDGQLFAEQGDSSLAIDLTHDADHAWANKEDLSYRMQWRLRFDEHNNEDGVQDMVFIGRDDLTLDLVYLVP